MKVVFNTLNEQEVQEVVALLQLMGEIPAIPQVGADVKPDEKPKATRKRATKPKVDPKPAPTPEKAPEPKEDTPKIKVADLKESAKNATLRTDRDTVRKAIAEFGGKLADVAEADFGKLYKKLQTLGA